MEASVFLLAAGMARVISSLMVIFNRMQLEDFGSEERRACGEQTTHDRYKSSKTETEGNSDTIMLGAGLVIVQYILFLT